MLRAMKEQSAVRHSRREWLGLSSGMLLGLGLWSGCARWRDRGQGGAFRFAVLNDVHFHTERCPAWFERVRASIQSHQPRPEFCLVVGDLVEHGTATELGGVNEALRSFGIPFYPVLGNHDHLSDTDRAPWDRVFAGRENYWFEHRGWQFVGVDSTQGTPWENTKIQHTTLQWVDENLRKLRPSAPTVLFTHFPLGAGVKMRPVNADDLLERFRGLNLTAVFNGHFHGFSERNFGPAVLTTNRCCAISRDNHDGTKEKGYFLCDATQGRIVRQFVPVAL